MTRQEANEALYAIIPGLREEVAAETARSRFRDRSTGKRIHPISADIRRLIDYAVDRRRRHPDARGIRDAAHTLYHRNDPEAMRVLVDAILDYGACTPTIRRTCERVLVYCDQLDLIFELLRPITSDSDVH
jgi:hypothetical protein